ncbi:MAG: DUF1573 domain-containing protein [Bacteroidaceae bacterium]|nr:DUF1573 domain-containing protein [Bacteroidaceae bacterium]
MRSKMNAIRRIVWMALLWGALLAPVMGQEGERIVIPDSLKNRPIEVPRIEFAEREHDFGKFAPVGTDTLKLHTFTFTNTGQKPLVVLRAVSSCGCTQPTHTLEPVMPGDTGIVTVGFRGEGQRKGRFRKSVTVYTDDPRSYVRLFISGELKSSK